MATLAVALAVAALLAPPDPPTPYQARERELIVNPEADVVQVGSYDAEDSGFLTTSTQRGTVELTDERSFRGDSAMLARVRGLDDFAYARVEEHVEWDEGDDVWYGAAFYLEPGFKAAQGDGSVDLLRWDNWREHAETTDHGGLALLSDGTIALIREQVDGAPWEVVLGRYPVPEGRWVWLEVRQRFSPDDGRAVNEVWMDGRRLGANTQANSFGRTITRHRAGIVATPDPQPDELRLYLDQPTISRRGPIMTAG